MEGQQNDQQKPGEAWQYKPDGSEGQGASLTPGITPQLQVVSTQYVDSGSETVTWTASEFIAHEKSPLWYVALAAITIVSAALIYFLSKDHITTVIVVVVAIIFGVAAARKPRQIQYSVNFKGITVGQRAIPYASFRSFSIVEEGPFASIVFWPMKRFVPYTSAYLDPSDEEKIITVVSEALPIEEHKSDIIDNFLKRIRF